VDTIRAVVGRYPHTASLVDTATALDAHTEIVVSPLAGAGGFSRILEDLCVDVFELPIVSFLVAHQQGVPIVASPLFVTRRFHHDRLLLQHSKGVRDPSDLPGRSAGLRYHGFTDGTWARGILSHDFGLDSRQVTWVTVEPETVRGAPIPPNVRPSLGASLDDLMLEGKLAARILEPGRRLDGPGIEPVFKDFRAAEASWFANTGVVPINHLIAIRRRVLEDRPRLGEQLLEVFSEAKRQAIAHLPRSPEPGSQEAGLVRLRTFLGDDPMPYGLDANRAPLEMILRLAVEQQVITTPTDLATAFATTPV
jgi:4,5-dihydroxyphthalate decarboxylase